MCHDCRLRAAGKANADGVKRSRPRDRAGRGIPVPEANAELQANIDVCFIKNLIYLIKYFLLMIYLTYRYVNFVFIFTLAILVVLYNISNNIFSMELI